MKPPSQRQLRVGEVIRRALSETLSRGDVPGLDLGGTIVSISEVRMSPDLKIATCFVTPIGPGDPQALVKALAKAAPKLRSEIVRSVSLKFAPTLKFRADTSFDAFGDIDAILRSPEVTRDTRRSRPAAEDE